MVTTKTMMAATADHQIRAAMTGSPTNSQAPTARVSVPLALRSANASASRITRNIVPHFVERYDAGAIDRNLVKHGARVHVPRVRPDGKRRRGWSARVEQRAWLQRLVEPESAAAGQFDGGDEPPALLRHAAAELDSLRFELAYGRLDVVAHQIELIAAAIRRGRVRGQLRRRQREDGPAVAGVDRRQSQDLREEGPVGGCVIGIEDRVNAGDRHEGESSTSPLASSVSKRECRIRLGSVVLAATHSRWTSSRST